MQSTSEMLHSGVQNGCLHVASCQRQGNVRQQRLQLTHFASTDPLSVVVCFVFTIRHDDATRPLSRDPIRCCSSAARLCLFIDVTVAYMLNVPLAVYKGHHGNS